MNDIYMFTSPSGKRFITNLYDGEFIDIHLPECAVFKKAVMKYGMENFDIVKLQTMYDFYDDSDAVLFIDDEIAEYKPEYNINIFK